MKRSTKVISIIIVFFLIIASVIVARTMIGKHFQKKFGKRPPPGIIVTEVVKKEFSEKIETFGTAISNRTKSFRIKKDDLIGDLKLNNYVKKGNAIIKLKSGNIIAPFNGVVGYTGLTEDIFVTDSTFVITLDDNSIIYSDIKIPENYSSVVKKGLPIEAKVSSYENKIFTGEVDFISSRINAGSLLEVSVKFNLRNSLSIPDTSVMMEGEKAYVYKVSKDNIANKIEIKIGARQEANIEVLSGLNIGDIIVAEGLKKVYPRSKIKPIEKGSQKSESDWKKKT